jgi:hypothetical protein
VRIFSFPADSHKRSCENVFLQINPGLYILYTIKSFNIRLRGLDQGPFPITPTVFWSWRMHALKTGRRIHERRTGTRRNWFRMSNFRQSKFRNVRGAVYRGDQHFRDLSVTAATTDGNLVAASSMWMSVLWTGNTGGAIGVLPIGGWGPRSHAVPLIQAHSAQVRNNCI